jgi:hypothetical protein
VALTGGRNIPLLLEQARRWRPESPCWRTRRAWRRCGKALLGPGSRPRRAPGRDGGGGTPIRVGDGGDRGDRRSGACLRRCSSRRHPGARE